MENLDVIVNGIWSLVALLISGFAIFKIQKNAEATKQAEKAVEALTNQAHEVIAVEAEEDHEEVTEALKKDDKAAAIADLFNDRRDR